MLTTTSRIITSKLIARSLRKAPLLLTQKPLLFKAKRSLATEKRQLNVQLQRPQFDLHEVGLNWEG